jgi:hypothetical protein
MPWEPDDSFMRDFFRMRPRQQERVEKQMERVNPRMYIAIQLYKLVEAMRNYAKLLP